jgi:hypothetical protein
MMGRLSVQRATRMDCLPFLIDRHYAGRIPSISIAWGLFLDGVIEGIVAYGTPSSAPLRAGIAGADFASSVLELNRLCLKSNAKNHASFLVGASLRSMHHKIVVSYADPTQGHVGYVYQACNFLYLGLSEKRTDWKVRGQEHKHGQTVADEFRCAGAGRADLMREKYGDDFYLSPRPRKHRYAYITGPRKFRRDALASLRYRIEPYPKSDVGLST